MKRFCTILLTVALSLAMCLAFTSCSRPEPATDVTTTAATSGKGHQSDTEKSRGYYYYEAIFLDKDTVLKAFKQAAPDYPKNDFTPPEYHVTTAFKPEEKHTSLYGTKVTVHITGYTSGTVYRDDGAGESSNEGFLVELSTDNEEMQELLDSYDKVMHITGSYSAEGYYTEYLDWDKAVPMDITLTGTFGGADSDENFFTTPE